jgi:hypothetical protein
MRLDSADYGAVLAVVHDRESEHASQQGLAKIAIVR